MTAPLPEEDFATRRAALAAQIERQRGELVHAYQQLEKPIRYTEYGMKGFGFIRQNPWIFAAVPAAVNLVSTLFGKKKKQLAPAKGPSMSQTGPPPKKLSRVAQTAMNGVEQGLRLYNLYRRVRSILP